MILRICSLFLSFCIAQVFPAICEIPQAKHRKYQCEPSEICCLDGCCAAWTEFYKRWYFWLCIAVVLLLCSGAGFWLRRARASQQDTLPLTQIRHTQAEDKYAVPVYSSPCYRACSSRLLTQSGVLYQKDGEEPPSYESVYPPGHPLAEPTTADVQEGGPSRQCIYSCRSPGVGRCRTAVLVQRVPLPVEPPQLPLPPILCSDESSDDEPVKDPQLYHEESSPRVPSPCSSSIPCSPQRFITPPATPRRVCLTHGITWNVAASPTRVVRSCAACGRCSRLHTVHSEYLRDTSPARSSIEENLKNDSIDTSLVNDSLESTLARLNSQHAQGGAW